MFYPTTLKESRSETIGKWYTLARRIAVVAVIASVFVFGYVDKTVGFWMLLLGGFSQVMLIRRENYIEAIRQIRRGGDILERLLLSGDRRFVLEQIQKDTIWRGDEVDPDITRQLNELNNAEEVFKSRMDKFIDDLTRSFAGEDPKSEDPKSN